jgi:hypothetical protein
MHRAETPRVLGLGRRNAYIASERESVNEKIEDGKKIQT